MKHRYYHVIVVLTALLTLMSCASARSGEQFVNESGPYEMSFFKGAKAVLFASRENRTPARALPIREIDFAEVDSHAGPLLYRLGHSSIMLKLNEQLVLIDPVFSERASPVQWLGPKRFHPVPLSVADLPDIAAVVVSHNHYDHLDKGTVKRLAEKVGVFLVPLGVGQHLRDWGIRDDAIIEMDWWGEKKLHGLTFVATPAQHFSGRSLNDRNDTLWASWVIQGEGANLFFSGDSGYFPGFKEIGDRYGPFDLTMIENGAYNQAWRFVHMMPEESVQAHMDLQGKVMLPIHNSTFDLSTHAWFEPMERVSQFAQTQGVSLVTPIIGAPVSVLAPSPTYAWWRVVTQQQFAGGNGESCEQAC